MRICFHTNFEITQKYIGGTERFLIKISKELKNFGHEPYIVCTSQEEETDVEGIKVFGRIPSRFRDRFAKYTYFSSAFIKNEIIGDRYSVDSLRRLSDYTQGQLDGLSADVFHLNSFAAASFLKPNGDFFVTNHENELEYDSYWGDGFFRLLSEQIKNRKSELHHYRKLLVPTSFYAHEYTNKFALEVLGINLGIHLEDFPYIAKMNRDKADFKKEDGIIILLPSRFQVKQKGHDTAVKACAILKEKNIPFKMIFTGVKKSSEKYLPDFYEMVRKYNIENDIEIVTFADIQTAYFMCDVVISPEKYCSYGLSVSESLSLGIPTVLSNIPTYSEIADTYPHAFFFESESHEELANHLIRLYENGCTRDRKAAINFRTKFDMRTCARKYAEIYNEFVCTT